MSSTYEPMNGGRAPETDHQSLGSLVGELTSDLSTLMRQEVELAKAELKAEAGKAGKAVGMFGGAGFAGWMVAVFASLALMFALRTLMPIGWAALVVAVLWAVVGAALLMTGRKNLKDVRPVPAQTVQTLKEDVQWAKAQKS